MTKKTLKKKSFAELVNLRAKMDVTDNDHNILFILQELNKEDFEIAFQSVFNYFVENKPIENLQDELLPFLMRKMLVSNIYEIDGLPDKDIVDTINSAGYEIVSQVNEAVEKLVMQKIFKQINKINDRAKELEQLTKEVETKEGE